MKILYLGEGSTGATAKQRADALCRLGHCVYHVEPRRAFPQQRWALSLAVRTGFRAWLPLINWFVIKATRHLEYDLIWVDCGSEVGPSLLRRLKRPGCCAVNYNHDDPYGNRDGRKWDQYIRSLPLYDLVTVVREENIKEARALGACRVARVFRTYDPVAHAPLVMNESERRLWACEVVFVGSWMKERGPFMTKLLELGVPLVIQGDGWHKAPEYSRLRSVVRGGPVFGSDYVKALQCAKIALGMLSSGNRDLHTTRSAEIPYIGGAVFCAERTAEHTSMFKEGEEALFWSSPEECASVCKAFLANSTRRDRMAAAARERVHQLHLSNDAMLAWMLRCIKTNDTKMIRSLAVDLSTVQ